MEFVAPSEQACGLLAAARIRVRLVSLSPHQHEGMARRKAQTYGSCLAARGRLAARQWRRFPASGPAFRLGHRAPGCAEAKPLRLRQGEQVGRPSPSFARRSRLREGGRPVAQKPKSSANSWRGLLVVPGGAPMPPECLVATRPAGHRPSSRLTTPHENAPSEGRGECNVRED